VQILGRDRGTPNAALQIHCIVEHAVNQEQQRITITADQFIGVRRGGCAPLGRRRLPSAVGRTTSTFACTA
jgi:hypothetical protein